MSTYSTNTLLLEEQLLQIFRKFIGMNKKNKLLKKSLGSITLKELEEKGLVEPNLHLSDGNYIGGLTSPSSNEYWKSLPTVKIKR